MDAWAMLPTPVALVGKFLLQQKYVTALLEYLSPSAFSSNR